MKIQKQQDMNSFPLNFASENGFIANFTKITQFVINRDCIIKIKVIGVCSVLIRHMYAYFTFASFEKLPKIGVFSWYSSFHFRKHIA